MKVGKVFEKQAARKQVASIEFGETAATITLKMGWSSHGATQTTVRSAHEARLFIDAAVQGEVQSTVIPAPVARVEAPAVEAPAPAANDNLILVDVDWVRARARGLVELPKSGKVRLTTRSVRRCSSRN